MSERGSKSEAILVYPTNLKTPTTVTYIMTAAANDSCKPARIVIPSYFILSATDTMKLIAIIFHEWNISNFGKEQKRKKKKDRERETL